MFESNHNFYQMTQASRNYLLLRAEVGKTRPSFHQLPQGSFLYGKRSGEDNEGARDLIKTWKVHEQSKEMPREHDYISINNKSVAKGYSTSTQFRIYKKAQGLRPSVSQSNIKNKSICSDVTFGMPLRPATPISAVIGNFYGRVASEIQHDYYTPQEIKTQCKFSSTKGFELLKASKMQRMQEKKQSEFKMRKFNAVKTRTDCWRK